MSAVAPTTTRKARHSYIERKPGVCSGKPVIAGSRIKVTQIAIEYERLGWTPDEIIDAHPHLRLEQVHDALSFYYENQKQLDAEILADEQFIIELRQHYPSRLMSPHGS